MSRRVRFIPGGEPPIKPGVDPLERGELDGLDVVPRPTAANLFRLVEPDDRFRERVVVRIAGAADGRLDARVGEALGVPNRHALRPAITVITNATYAKPRHVATYVRSATHS